MKIAHSWDAIVLAGGEGRRLGGVDKAELVVAGRRLLDAVTEALAGAQRIVVVGPERPLAAPVTWTREQPAGGGPVAALQAGIEEVDAPVVVVVSVDLPRLVLATIDRLLEHRSGDGAIATDADGRPQPLVAVYATEAVRARLAAAAPSGSMHELIEGLVLREVPLGRSAEDVDTWEEVRAMEADPLDSWVPKVLQGLGLEGDVDTKAILDIARVAAHAVARPAAPVTTYLVGRAVERGDDVAEVKKTIERLAREAGS